MDLSTLRGISIASFIPDSCSPGHVASAGTLNAAGLAPPSKCCVKPTGAGQRSPSSPDHSSTKDSLRLQDHALLLIPSCVDVNITSKSTFLCPTCLASGALIISLPDDWMSCLSLSGYSLPLLQTRVLQRSALA